MLATRLKVAVVDDEPLARRRILRLLGASAEIEVVASCENAESLAQALRQHRLDAVFLDIDMPGADGFSAIAAMPDPAPKIVFVTAYSQHAARAFDIDATDYLVKPVSQERLLVAVERLRRDLAPSASTENATESRYLERLTLSTGRASRMVEAETIDHIMAHANYLEIHAEGRAYVLRRQISWMEQHLDPARFLRIHRSHLVRIDAIDRIEPIASGRFQLWLRSGVSLRSGRGQRDRIRDALGLRDGLAKAPR